MKRDRKNRVGGPFVRPEADYQRIVIVVDQLGRGGQALA
jgi:hypothetical protein